MSDNSRLTAIVEYACDHYLGGCNLGRSSRAENLQRAKNPLQLLGILKHRRLEPLLYFLSTGLAGGMEALVAVNGKEDIKQTNSNTCSNEKAQHQPSQQSTPTTQQRVSGRHIKRPRKDGDTSSPKVRT